MHCHNHEHGKRSNVPATVIITSQMGCNREVEIPLCVRHAAKYMRNWRIVRRHGDPDFRYTAHARRIA